LTELEFFNLKETDYFQDDILKDAYMNLLRLKIKFE
jgi:hypothetical protein